MNSIQNGMTKGDQEIWRPPLILCIVVSFYLYIVLFQLYLTNHFGVVSFLDEIAFVVVFVVAAFIGITFSYRNLLLVGSLFIYLCVSAICSAEINVASFVWILYEYCYPVLAFLIFYRLGVRYDFTGFFLGFMKYLYAFFIFTMCLSILFPSLDLLTIARSHDGPDSLRIAWFIGNPNSLGYVLLTLLAFQLFPLATAKGTFKSNIVLMSICFFIVITSSRSSLIIMLVLLTYRQIFSGHVKTIFVGMFSALIFLSVFLLFLRTDLGSTFLLDRIITGKVFYDNARVELWISFLDLFSNSPAIIQLLGFGPTVLIRNEGHIFDSMYVLVLMELGLVGFLILGAALFFYFAHSVFNVVRSNKALKPYYLVALSLLTIFLMAGLTSSAFRVFPFNFFFYGVFGLLLGTIHLVRQSERPQ